jgi:hypothetical protein
VAHELAAKSPFFRDVVEASPSDSRARKVMADAGVVLSLMDPGFASLALELYIPLYVADSLFWMRESVPECFRAARCYWVQNFLGVSSKVAHERRGPVVTGPIVREGRPSPPPVTKTLVVNLGGYESIYTDYSRDLTYAEFVCQGLSESGLLETFPGDAVVMGGERCINALRERFRGCGAEFISVAHEDAVSLMAHSSLFLTSPGMTAAMEGMHSGVPVFFLPPQNFSQWLILKEFRDVGLAPCSFHWEDNLERTSFQRRMPWEDRAKLVRNTIHSLAGEEQCRISFREKLAACVQFESGGVVESQRLWFNSLGTNGARVIAEELTSILYS